MQLALQSSANTASCPVWLRQQPETESGAHLFNNLYPEMSAPGAVAICGAVKRQQSCVRPVIRQFGLSFPPSARQSERIVSSNQ